MPGEAMNLNRDIYLITTRFPHPLKVSETPKTIVVEFTVMKRKSERKRYLFQRSSQVQKLTQSQQQRPSFNRLTGEYPRRRVT